MPKTLTKIGDLVSAILLGDIRELIARMDERVIYIVEDLKDLKKGFGDIREKVDDMYPKVDLLWKDKIAQARSPRQLNDAGIAVLERSGIKEVMDEQKAELLALVKAAGAKNAYDAELSTLAAVRTLPERHPEIIDRLKAGAFNAGTDIDTMLLVGGMYLRDLIFPELGFSLKETMPGH